MRVLIACEFSGRVRDAFLALGHDAYSCDILNPRLHQPLFPDYPNIHPNHIVGDALPLLTLDWDLLIAHPPCTYLTNARASRRPTPDLPALISQATQFFLALYNAPIPRIAIENPPGRMSRILKPTQTILPSDFGDDSSKRACLWLRNLPPLRPTTRTISHVPPQTLSVSATRLRPYLRSITTPGVAAAMAAQWGALGPPSLALPTPTC